jgi:hypothetical protein
MALTVHLPHEQTVIYDGIEGPEEALYRAECSRTTLMAYFEANVNNLIGFNGQCARDILYVEFPALSGHVLSI